jgi:hypothetical protein
MKKQLFIKHIKFNGVKILPTREVDVCTLEDFRHLKSFIQYIDFDCKINSKGGCQEQPESLTCCCDACYENAGYFRTMIDTEINKYSRPFSIKTGFWRKDRGCILAHKMRSITCLSHHCNFGKREGFGFGMMHIRHKLHDIRDRL